MLKWYHQALLWKSVGLQLCCRLETYFSDVDKNIFRSFFILPFCYQSKHVMLTTTTKKDKNTHLPTHCSKFALPQTYIFKDALITCILRCYDVKVHLQNYKFSATIWLQTSCPRPFILHRSSVPREVGNCLWRAMHILRWNQVKIGKLTPD